jgi:aminopeptidase
MNNGETGLAMSEEMNACARTALIECLGLGRNELLLVVCDPPCAEIGHAFWNVGSGHCRETVLVQISPRRQNGNEPPDPVGAWFGQFDVAVMPTSKSLTHTQARRSACERGTRIATLPGITPEVFLRTMQTDWKRLGSYTRRVASQLSRAKKVRVVSAAGSDFTFLTGGAHAKADDGVLDKKGVYGNLPAGEAFFAPMEGSAEGTVVFDGSFPLSGLLATPLALEVKKGLVVRVADHPCRTELERLFEKYRSDARNIAEFGVGTLDTARLSGNVLEDEKVRGTVHVALGNNASMGGTVTVPLHLDGIIKQPSVWLDGALWMDKGELNS